jgi:gluconokinase
MPSPLVIALDVGSSSVRASLRDATGRPLRGRTVQVPLGLTTDGSGGSTLAFDRLLEVLSVALDQLVARSGPALARVVAVGTSCFLHSVAGLDAGGRPITPLLTWADTTSADAATGLRAQLDARSTWQQTGCPIHASYWPAKIVRLRATPGPGVRSFAGAPTLLFEALTGIRAIDLSEASGTGLLDRRPGDWHAGLLAELDLDVAALPPIAGPWASARLKGWSADRWPALAGVPWFVPWSDAWCGNVGLGQGPGQGAALQVGTSGAMRVIVGDPVAEVPDGLFAHRLPDGTALVGGQLSEGGGTIATLAGLLGRSAARLDAAATDLPPDGHGLTVLPFLSGERGPGYHAGARGVIAGLHLATTAADVHLAVLEAIAYRFAELDRRLAGFLGDVPEVVAAGGAVGRSSLLAGILAAALGRPIGLSADPEASTRGAALVALAAAGVIDDPAGVPPPPSRRIVPDPTRIDRYREAAARQGALYDRILGPQEVV